MTSASAVAAGPISWSAPMVIDHPPPYDYIPVAFGFSCPSESFCAGRSSGSAVITSTTPAGGSGAWGVTRARVGAPIQRSGSDLVSVSGVVRGGRRPG